MTEENKKINLDAVIEGDPTGEAIVMPPEDQIAQDPIVYFCKECRKLIDKPVPVSKKNNFTFQCPECKEKAVSWGTKRSIYNFFHLDDEGNASAKKEKDKGTQVARLKEAKESSNK